MDLVQYEKQKDDPYVPKNPEEFIKKVREFIHIHPEILARLWMDAYHTTFCPYQKDREYHQYTYTTHDDAIKYLESIADESDWWVLEWMKFYRFEKDSFERTSEHKGPLKVTREELKMNPLE